MIETVGSSLMVHSRAHLWVPSTICHSNNRKSKKRSMISYINNRHSPIEHHFIVSRDCIHTRTAAFPGEIQGYFRATAFMGVLSRIGYGKQGQGEARKQVCKREEGLYAPHRNGFFHLFSNPSFYDTPIGEKRCPQPHGSASLVEIFEGRLY